jgi:MarR family transcriptional regulator, organic hydroperoxide resistance regulator
MQAQANSSDERLLLDNQLCFGLYAAARKVIQLYAPLLERLDLTYTQYISLLVLWEHQSLSVKHLGDYLMLDSGTLTPMLKKLEKKGLVTRTRSVQDERSVIIRITEQGQSIKAQALAFLPTLVCSTCLSEQELVDLRAMVKKLLQGLGKEGDPLASIPAIDANHQFTNLSSI